MMKKRIMSALLAVCMAATMLPETFIFAGADDSGAERTEIAGFEPLESRVAEQTAPPGLGQEALVSDGLLILPSSLTAWVLVPDEPQVEPGPGFEGPEIFDESAAGGDDGGVPSQPDAVTEMVRKAVEVPVTWPEVIDGETVGVVVLEPILTGEYVLGEGVSAPTITVTVTDAGAGGDTEPDGSTEPDGGMEIAGFEPLESWAAEQTVPLGLGQEALIEYLMLHLPDTVTARIGDETAEIPACWPEDVIGGKETGVFVFEPILPEGYALGEGVSLPRITVTVVDDEQLFWMLMPQNDASEDKQFQMTGDSSSTIEAGAPGGRSTYGQGTFNIQGRDGDRTYKTTFGNGGYFVVSSVDGNEIHWKNANATDVSMGSSLTGTVSGEYVYNGRYVKVTYTVENTGSTAKEFKIGTYADVMIDNNDYAEVSWIKDSGGRKTGISMDGAPKNSFKFSALLPDAATMWYGSYSSAPKNVFADYNGDDSYNRDSGMAWSWNGTVPAGGTWSRYVLIGVGELPTPPDPPIIDITAEGGLHVKPGDTITITGSGTTGCSAHVSFFGTEYQADIGADGKFSIEVTVPADTANGDYTFDYWAVSAEGGVSEFKKADVTVTRPPEIKLAEVVPELTEEQDGPSEDWYNSFIVRSSGAVSHTDVSTGKTGTFTITYTAHLDGYDDATAELKYKVNPLPPGISMSKPTQKSDTSFAFNGTLDHTGGLTWTEMGFVYGSMQNPSLTFNNNTLKVTAVQEKGAAFSATATDIVKGVTYYVRPYAKASDGTTIYGAQQSFGSGVPQYGTFTITNNGSNTFTVTRTGGTEGKQTVYFRTVNGSAVGGTHFDHQAGTLTFNDGDTSKTITITEKGVTTQYNSKPATAYSNADRVYFVELYRVDGGGTLGTTIRASRTMGKDTNHMVDRNCYVMKKESIEKTNNQTTSSSYANAFTMQRTYTQYVPYLKETADSYEMHMNAYVYEQEDGYEWLQFTSGSQIATIKFEINRTGNYKNWVNGWFPRTAGYTENGVIYTNELSDLTPVESNMGLGTIYRLNITTDPITVAIRATGSGGNHWELGGCEQESVYRDIREPQLIGVAPMADTTYKAGDTVTISLIFDEIVDLTNSSLTTSSTINTSWGEFHYAGGADTNVLYYEYTVPENGSALSGELKVNSLGSSAGQIKDMCNQSAASNATGTGSTTLTVDATAPSIEFKTATVSNGTATVPVTVKNATQVRYAWTKDATLPVAWQEWSNASGGDFQTRQEPGTYYLHILAFNASSGAQKTDYTKVEIKADGGGSGGGAMPALEVNVVNDRWATSRDITVTKRVPASAAITVTKPDGGTTTLDSGTSTFTAEANGTYKFTITVDGEAISAYANVSMIDRGAPTAAVSGPATLIQSEDVTLTVTLTDGVGESGIDTTRTEAKWSDGSTASLTDKGDGTYTAMTPGTGDWTLTVKAYDKAGNVSNTATSSEYKVVTEGPKIEITKRTVDSKTGVTFEYTVTHSKEIPLVSVQLPNGDMVEVNQTDYAEYSGSFTLSEEASNLYIYATDDLGHVGRSEPLSVSSAEAVDVTAPDVRLDSVPFSWTNEKSVTVSVDVYDLGGAAFGSWTGPESGSIDKLEDTSAETGAPGTYAASFTVTKNGTYTVTVTDENGNEGKAEITIDFIDRKVPDVDVSGINSAWTSAAQTASFDVSDTEDGENKASGVVSFEYAVTTTNSAPAPEELTPLTATGGDVTVGDADNGTFYIYYRAVDNAGNVTTGWSAPIKVDKQRPTLEVSGGTTGNPDKTEQTLNVKSSFGVSGGKVTVRKPDGSSEDVHGDTCTVTEAGTYVFTATSYADLTATRTVVINAVSFDGNGAAASPATQLVASGGKAVEPVKPVLAGHTFVTWEKGGATYDFGSTVNADVALTAKWTLDTPSVALTASAASATYNNGEPVITLTATSSHAATDAVTYTYEWFKDGEKITGAGNSTYFLRTVYDNGTYTVKVTAHCGHSLTSGKVTSDAVTATVTAAEPEIAAPTVAPLTYGDELTDDCLSGGSASLNGVTVPGTFSWEEQGQYPAATTGTEHSVVFTPKDSDNYLSVTFDVSVTVKKAPLTPSVAANLVPGGVYDGTRHSHASADGEIVLSGAQFSETPTAHGQVEFVTRDAGEDKPVNVTGITLDGEWGKNYELSTDKLSGALTDADVAPKVLTFDWHILEGGKETDQWNELYYTKGEYTVTATATNLVEGDECVLTVGENGVRTDAGTYTAKITGISNNNYALPDDITREYTIHKSSVTFTIDAEVKPVHDWTREVNTDPNPEGYVIEEDADTAVWNDHALTMTYDSLEHRANVRQDSGVEMGDGLFSVSFDRVKDAAGEAVTEDAGKTFRAAGTYEIQVTLTEDASSFMFAGSEPEARTLRIGTVTVKPYEVRVTWQNLTFVYHGHKMHPTVRVENAFVADEQPDEEAKQGFLKDPTTFHEDLMAFAGTDSADAGDYLVTVTLYGSEAGNYTVSDPTAAVVIQPAPVIFEVTNNEWLYHEEGQDRDVTLTAAWGEVTNSPDTVVDHGYPGAGTRITLSALGVTAGDIQYRLEDGTVVDDPTEIGTYQVWVRIPNANFRHASTAGGDFHNVGVLRIAANDHPATYTVTFDPGRDERGNRFTGVTTPEPMTGLIPTQEITLPPAPENAPAGYVFAGWSRGGALYQPGGEFYMAYSDVTFEARWTREIFNIAGVVIDDTETPVPYVSVALMMGEHQMGLTTTDEEGTFRFDGLIPNTYNLVFTWNGVIKTYMVEITDRNVEGGTYTLPGYRLNTVVEVAPGSGSVVVDLDPIITDEGASELYGDDERTLVEQNGGTVEFMMKVEDSSKAEGMTEKLRDVPVSADNIGMVLDMSLTKTVTGVKSDGTADTTVTQIDDSKVLIANLIYLPADLQGKDGYTVYRFHDEDGDGVDEVQTITTGANRDGERVEIVKDGTAVMVYARYYSTYVLTWYQKPSSRVTVADTPHGTVTSNRRSAAPGTKVTLNVKPDEGYEAEGLTVTDSRGREIPVTDNGDGTYSFTMPGRSVTVKATFRAKSCDGGEDCPSRRFTDLNVEKWYHEYTDFVIAHGLMLGVGGTAFAPEMPISRAMVVMVLWREAGSPVVSCLTQYDDVEPETWYTEAVRWATSEGVVNGYGNGKFGPDDPITREQFAAMLWRYAKARGWSVSVGEDTNILSFNDFDQISEWAIPALQWAAGAGIMQGEGGSLDPRGQATRAQAAAMFKRFLLQK